MAALRLRKRYGCRVITDVMDTWPETLLQAVQKPGGRGQKPEVRDQWASRFLSAVLCSLSSVLLWPYWQMLRKACAESDALSAQSYAFADFAKTHGAAGEVHVCYLGAERVEPRAVDVSPAHLPTSPPRILRLLYLGAMGRSYDLETVLEALRILNAESPGRPAECTACRYECVFVGDGEKRAALEAQQIPGCRFTGFLTGEALEQELHSADIGVVPFFKESGVAVPYKAGDYLAYGLPLLSTIDGELGGLIRKHQCGSVYREKDAEDLVSAIRQYAENPTLLNQAKNGAKQCFEESFDRSLTYPIFSEWITSKN